MSKFSDALMIFEEALLAMQIMAPYESTEGEPTNDRRRLRCFEKLQILKNFWNLDEKIKEDVVEKTNESIEAFSRSDFDIGNRRAKEVSKIIWEIRNGK